MLTMEVFVELKKRLAFLGIKPVEKSHFSLKNALIVFLLTYCSVAMSAFVFFESKSLIDFGNSFYGAASSTLNICTFSTLVMKSTKIFKIFRRLEDSIKKRKFDASYSLPTSK